VENEQRQRAPFDQQAALEELERFGRDIERYRAQRKAVGEEFETFLRSFETPPESAAIPVATPPAPRREPRIVLPIPIAAAEPAAIPVEAVVPPVVAPVPLAEEPASEPAALTLEDYPDPREHATDAPAAVPFEAPPPAGPRGRSSFGTPVLLGGALVVILAGGMLVRTLWNRAPEPTPPVVTPAAAAATPGPAATAPVAAIARPTSASELTTIRRVWMRVTVDGERVLEREVPANTTVPLNAEKSIVIRTGDAGAVRLSIRGGEPAALGAEGEVVTRSFTVPPRSVPAGR
jgi:hypothetical protein